MRQTSREDMVREGWETEAMLKRAIWTRASFQDSPARCPHSGSTPVPMHQAVKIPAATPEMCADLDGDTRDVEAKEQDTNILTPQ